MFLTTIRKLSVLAVLGLVVQGLVPAIAHAQQWPTRPVRLIVPFPPGGGTDAFARPLAKVLAQQLGQQVVIDNRGGAGGTLGAELAAKSAPDGYTFLVGAVHHTIAVSMYPKLGYDLKRDLSPVTVLSYVPNVVVVNPRNMPVKDFAGFQKLVSTNPGKYNYASAGNGTTHHLTVELWKTMTGSFATHLPYRGAGPALADLLAGQADFMFDGLGSSIQHIKSGRLVALAVSSGKRSFALPNLPTLNEAGVKGYDAGTWYGLWTRAGTPTALIDRMQSAVAQALQGSELKAVWNALGADPGGQSPAEMARFVDAEIVKWAKVVKDSGARLD
ncbi:MAG: tricarboxylate binding receptor [Pseudomonadota bacterium]|jgi:tripartite-type tricarboxylate transporter receptor subunit TctC